jgi:hypothetical protein
MILQWRQIFFTEARTFISSISLGDAAAVSPKQTRTAMGGEIRLLHQALVLVGHQVSLNLGHEVHDHHHNDQQ